jgi:hypothetical protein
MLPPLTTTEKEKKTNRWGLPQNNTSVDNDARISNASAKYKSPRWCLLGTKRDGQKKQIKGEEAWVR